MKNISKTKITYYFLIALGFVLPISRIVFMEIPKMLGQFTKQILMQIMFQSSAFSFSWVTFFSIMAILTLLFHLFLFISIQVENSEKNMRFYTIATLLYAVSGTAFFYNQTPDMIFVISVYYLFLAISSLFVKKF